MYCGLSRTSVAPGSCCLTLAALLIGVPLAAQQPAADTADAVAIVAADVTRHVAVLAGDSFRGRSTPSRALEYAAGYVAGQFERLGLTRGMRGRDGAVGWIERYPIPGHLTVNYARAGVDFALLDSVGQIFRAQGEPGQALDRAIRHLTVPLASAAYLAVPRVSPYMKGIDGWSKGTVLVAGRHTGEALRRSDLRDLRTKTAVYIPPADLDSAAQQQVIDRLYAVSLGVVVLATADSDAFARELAAARQRPVRLVEPQLQNVLRPHGWVVRVWPGAVRDLLAAAGVDWAQLRRASTPVLRPLPMLDVGLQLPFTQPAADVPTAPNVAGVLEGSDSTLRDEYIVVLAHLDGRPVPPRADSAPAALSDNAAGVAGLLELAEAFSRPGTRPRRSVLFLATSGGGTGEFWGGHFSDVGQRYNIVSVLNLDFGGRTMGDTVVIDGLQDADSIATVGWIAALHPELRLTVADGGTAFTPQSDHYAFIRFGVPMLNFHTGAPAAAPGPSGPAVPAETAARITRLAYYVGEAFADAPRRPRLSSLGRRGFLAGSDPRE